MKLGKSQKEVISKVSKYLETNHKNESTGHDYWHFIRVWNLSKKICKKEGGDNFIVELSALLHDVADWKFIGKNESETEKVKQLLNDFGVDSEVIRQVCYIIENISFKGAKVKNSMNSNEGKIVQDADKLDAIGAIGVSRVFAYGGKSGRKIYDPKIKPRMHSSFEEYKNNNSASINHFYEKLLLLKDRMNTKTGKKMAVQRHKFLELFLREFFAEWKGKR